MAATEERLNAEAAALEAGYTWEQEYKRSWDVIQEDAKGQLSTTIDRLKAQLKRTRLYKDARPIQRGVIRHLMLIVDMSAAIQGKDLKPSRLSLVIETLDKFIKDYFDQNPISQLGIMIMRDGIAEMVTELSGNPLDHTRALRSRKLSDSNGEPSLQNALEVAFASLRHTPVHGSREVLVVMAALTTSDPGDIQTTLKSLMAENIKVSMIGLAAEVHICKQITKKTNGSYGIVMNESHFEELVQTFILPPKRVAIEKNAEMVLMGFPNRIVEKLATLCACHQNMSKVGFNCPRCRSKVCQIPTDCPICNLTLVSSPHLARSYHHLFPVEAFHELQKPSSGDMKQPLKLPEGVTVCCGCNSPFDEHSISAFQCQRCVAWFCLECDLFVHESLHNCPSCISKPGGHIGNEVAGEEVVEVNGNGHADDIAMDIAMDGVEVVV